MTSLRGDGGVHFFIGAIQVASVRFIGPKGQKASVSLICPPNHHSTHENVSKAMTEMHRLLKSPPPERL